MSARDAGEMLIYSIAAKGAGSAILILGILGVIIPWINRLIYDREEMDPDPLEP